MHRGDSEPRSLDPARADPLRGRAGDRPSDVGIAALVIGACVGALLLTLLLLL